VEAGVIPGHNVNMNTEQEHAEPGVPMAAALDAPTLDIQADEIDDRTSLVEEWLKVSSRSPSCLHDDVAPDAFGSSGRSQSICSPRAKSSGRVGSMCSPK
jgi:hypothetical protein